MTCQQGDRFGGALDGAAKQFTGAYDAGQIPMEFVNTMRKKGQLIMGIGHRVKSINNPDMRVTLVKDFVKGPYLCDVRNIFVVLPPLSALGLLIYTKQFMQPLLLHLLIVCPQPTVPYCGRHISVHP